MPARGTFRFAQLYGEDTGQGWPYYCHQRRDIGYTGQRTPREELAVEPKSSNNASQHHPEAQNEDVQTTVFSRRQRLFIFTVTTLTACFSSLSGQIFFLAI